MTSALSAGIEAAPASREEWSELRGLAEKLVRSGAAAKKGATCPVDRRLEAFLNDHFADLAKANPLALPAAIALARYGLAREFSLPAIGDSYANEYVTSYRV